MINATTGRPGEGMTYQSTRAGAKPSGSAGPFLAGKRSPVCTSDLIAAYSVVIDDLTRFGEYLKGLKDPNKAQRFRDLETFLVTKAAVALLTDVRRELRDEEGV